MLQQEGSLISVSSIRESVRQLNLMGFFKDVQVKTTPVPGTTNQVDVDYQVKETPAGQASLNLGYGSGGLGLELGAGLNQPNFLGTGKTVGVNFSRSRYTSSYSINYFNPYYTVNNIGRGFNFYYQKTSPKALSNGSLYTFDTYGASVMYSIPLSLNDHMQVGAALNNISLNVGKDIFGQYLASQEIVSFIRHNGMNFNQLLLTASWSHVGQDRSIYPTQGFDQSLSTEISVPVSHKLKYYKAGYAAEYLLPLNQAHSFIFLLTGHLGYGNSYGYHPLPFFQNYTAGGLTLGQVRGYETSSLGPHDSFGNSIGGNLLTAGSAALIFPTGISDSIRTSVFVDAGNVFQTVSHADTFGAGPIRYSAGLGIEWRSPVGPLSFSIADPLNRQKPPSLLTVLQAISRVNPNYIFIPNYLNAIRNNLGDKADYFQFTMGTTF
jgi:outer membrane protein insertion porin family